MIGADGLGLFTYYDELFGLSVAHCENVACTQSEETDLFYSAGRNSAIAIGTDGLGLVAYQQTFGGDLAVAHCQNVACSDVSHSRLDHAGPPPPPNGHISITIGTDGFGLISYHHQASSDLDGCSLREPHLLDDDDDDDRLCRRGRFGQLDHDRR